MGISYEYLCPKCEYSVYGAEKPESGFLCTTETMIYLGCRELVDVVLESRQMPGTPESERLKIGVCSECEGKNLKKWGGSRPCPKCDARMEQGERMEMWD